jgi:hypothetical protein
MRVIYGVNWAAILLVALDVRKWLTANIHNLQLHLQKTPSRKHSGGRTICSRLYENNSATAMRYFRRTITSSAAADSQLRNRYMTSPPRDATTPLLRGTRAMERKFS